MLKPLNHGTYLHQPPYRVKPLKCNSLTGRRTTSTTVRCKEKHCGGSPNADVPVIRQVRSTSAKAARSSDQLMSWPGEGPPQPAAWGGPAWSRGLGDNDDTYMTPQHCPSFAALDLKMHKFRLTHSNQASTLPKQQRPSATAARTSAQLSSNQRILSALKYVEIGRPQRGYNKQNIIFTLRVELPTRCTGVLSPVSFAGKSNGHVHTQYQRGVWHEPQHAGEHWHQLTLTLGVRGPPNVSVMATFLSILCISDANVLRGNKVLSWWHEKNFQSLLILLNCKL